MGKLLDPFPQQQCQASSGIDPWREVSSPVGLLTPPPPPPPPPSLPASSPSLRSTNEDSSPLVSWDAVPGLEYQQIQALLKLAAKGVFWRHPSKTASCIFTLHHGGDVEADGNCLFSGTQKAMSLFDESPQIVRRRTVQRFLLDYRGGVLSKALTDQAIKNLYNPDLTSGWGVHVVQEVKLLAKKADRGILDAAISELVQCGIARENAAETVYKERCLSIVNGEAWAKYMSVAGDPGDEYDIITLLYAQDGLISIEENREGRAAAFGDDIAIESLATEYNREIYVVQAHGADAMVDAEHCIFFLSHRPRGEIKHHPVFLLMKGTGWCGSGADHYEPLVAQLAPSALKEKAAFVL